MSEAGRKSKLTPEVIEKITSAIRMGNDNKVAAALAGISEATYYKWLTEAEKADADPLFIEFSESVTQAQAQAEARAVSLIQKASNEGRWQASSWWLERKHPERWGRNDKIRQEISGTDGEPLVLSVDEMRKSVLAFLNESKHGSINSGTDTDPTA